MSLAVLSEDLILLICRELCLDDIISLRQVCHALCDATRAKVLWINKLEQGVLCDGQILPPYLKGYDFLDADALEALVRRMARLTRKWAIGDLSPVKIWRLYLPQSITWLRLVAGTWLFVASSDNHISKISCWDLSLVFQGYTEPLAEAYLPGHVKTGKLEVQDSGVVLALGLGPELLSVHIITLRQHSGCHVFSELSRIEGSSHVLMLRGNLVGCALRHGAIVPHIINWRDQRIHDIPPPPGGLDIPGRRSVPHLITIWNGILVVLRTNSLEFHALPTTAGDAIVFIKLIETPTIWEAAAVCDSASVDSPTSPLRLIVLSPLGIELCVVERDVLVTLNEEHTAPRICLAQTPQDVRFEAPWYRLCIGASGRRSFWLSASKEPSSVWDGPQVVGMAVQLLPFDTEVPCYWSKTKLEDHSAQPALWAIPTVDFDDALGLTVVGNCFGELAIYDHDGRHPELCGALSFDFTNQGQPIPPLLPTKPIYLGLSIVPSPMFRGSEWDPSLLSQWSQDDIVLNERWSKDWFSEYLCYWDWDRWQGASADLAWVLEHAYGFPGPVVPQAYRGEPELALQYLLFRSGHRYFVFSTRSEPNLRSWPLTPSPTNSGFYIPDAQPESFSGTKEETDGLNKQREGGNLTRIC
ncbi:hypothetical protein FB451DRAFT_129695 [Mycena latifolia]|nr:hypothetical protein FB451DRAFT_129695 [Mycena latifolia]